MRKIVLIVVALVAAAGLRADETNTVGRFVLQAATVLNDGQPEPCLFRIDTITGETWKLSMFKKPIVEGQAVQINLWTSVLEDMPTRKPEDTDARNGAKPRYQKNNG